MHLASLCISWSLTSQEKKAFWKKKTIVDHSPWSKGRLLVHAFWVKLFHLKKTRCHCELWYSATTRHWAVEITLVANDWFQCWHEARRQVTILQQDLPFSDKNRHWSIWLYLLVVTKAAIPPLWLMQRKENLQDAVTSHRKHLCNFSSKRVTKNHCHRAFFTESSSFLQSSSSRNAP